MEALVTIDVFKDRGKDHDPIVFGDCLKKICFLKEKEEKRKCCDFIFLISETLKYDNTLALQGSNRTRIKVLPLPPPPHPTPPLPPPLVNIKGLLI